jgi:hypothetical protein
MPVISIFIQIFELFDVTHTDTEDILAVSSLQGVFTSDNEPDGLENATHNAYKSKR